MDTVIEWLGFEKEGDNGRQFLLNSGCILEKEKVFDFEVK